MESADTYALKTNKDLRDVSFALRNLFKSGSLGAAEVLKQAGNMLPRFRHLLHAGSSQISNKGWPISRALSSLFPPNTMSAIKAGEESGRLEDVFERIWATAVAQEEINKVIRGLIMPFALVIVGLVISLGFLLILVPKTYRDMAKGAPPDYEPSASIVFALSANEFIVANWQLVVMGLLVFAVISAGFFMRESVREKASDLAIRAIIAIRPLGESYSAMKFGIMAQYLQIVSAAGLDAERRIDLVLQVLPPPLRAAMNSFRADMVQKGISKAADGEGRDEEDPRASTVLWPHYIRIAFYLADDGDWEVPMREFGDILLEDGKDKIKRQIAGMNVIAMIIVGLLLVIPIGLMYGTMGEILTMRIQMM